MATSTSQSICVNKETKVLKLRKNCRATERYMGSADVLKNGGESAYETWLGLGNKGSEQDFINSLRGSSGSSSSSFASTCYQKLLEAQSSGLFWTNSAHRSNFERSTGCVIRQIDVNPYAQVGMDQPVQITSSEYMGYYGGAGGGFDQYFSAGENVLYKVTFKNETGMSLCGGDSVVIVGSNPQDVYIYGIQSSSNLENKAYLSFGIGPEATEIDYQDKIITRGGLDFHFSQWPEVMPLVSTATLELTRVTNQDGEEVTDFQGLSLLLSSVSERVRIDEAEHNQRYEIDLSNETLPFRFTVSSSEASGIAGLSVTDGGDEDESERIMVGVESCETQGGIDDSGIVSGPFVYVINENLRGGQPGNQFGNLLSSEFVTELGFPRFAYNLFGPGDDN
jgi:hypothetical protein